MAKNTPLVKFYENSLDMPYKEFPDWAKHDIHKARAIIFSIALGFIYLLII